MAKYNIRIERTGQAVDYVYLWRNLYRTLRKCERIYGERCEIYDTEKQKVI